MNEIQEHVSEQNFIGTVINSKKHTMNSTTLMLASTIDQSLKNSLMPKTVLSSIVEYRHDGKVEFIAHASAARIVAADATWDYERL